MALAVRASPEPPAELAGLGSSTALALINPLTPVSHYANIAGAMGQSSSSESKGLKRAVPYMRGAANSFGFKKAPKQMRDAAGGAGLGERDYSQEALAKEQHCVTTAIKTGRTGKVGNVVKDVRTNRFGFKAPAVAAGAVVPGRGLSNKVADSSAQVLPKAAVGKLPPPAAAATATTHPVASKRPSPSSGAGRGAARAPGAVAAGRPSPPTSLPRPLLQPRGVMSHLPRAQLGFRPTTKDAKTAVNAGTRRLAPIATFDDEIGSSKESSMNEDSGLGGDTDTLQGVDVLDASPRNGQGGRASSAGTLAAGPRRSLRSLRDEEDDPNVITEIVPIAKMVSRASLRSIASLGGPNPTPSPKQLSARSSSRSTLSESSNEFRDDLRLFRGYGDTTEPKVYMDCNTAEKRPAVGAGRGGRYMKDYGPDEEQDEDWGQGEAMAEGEWRDEVGAVDLAEEADVPSELRELQATLCEAETPAKLADIVAAAASSELGLIEDESAPEDSLFSSSPPSSSDDSPSKHVVAPKAPAVDGSRRRVRTKRRERPHERQAPVAASTGSDCESKESPKQTAPGQPTAVKKDAPAAPATLSPEGSATPSNSFSLSDGRDFLIDDEIGDQPALTIQHKPHGPGRDCRGDESEMASLTESAASITLKESSSHHQAVQTQPQGRPLRKDGGGAGSLDVHPTSREDTLHTARLGGSLDSMATNSIDSEDLMMDFEDDTESKRFRSITKSWAGSPVLFWPRPRRARSFGTIDLDTLNSVASFATPLRERADGRLRSRSEGGRRGDSDCVEDDDMTLDNDGVLLELSSLMESVSAPNGRASTAPPLRLSQGSQSLVSGVPLRAGPGVGVGLGLGHSTQASSQASSGANSAPDSPRYSLASLGSSGVPSPLRPPRPLASSDSDESAMMRVDRGTYQHMYQDVVHIKTMLLKLKRVLQEAETLNPFESSLKNGLLHQLAQADESGAEDDKKTCNPGEEVVDLKRQVVLMKQQMEEKDRTIQLMQLQMMKYERVSDNLNENSNPVDLCNAATQTERMRPVSAGPSLLQSLPSESNGAPLVSWTDTWGRRSRTPASGSSNSCNGFIENRTSSASRVPTASSRTSRSVIPAHQRLGVGSLSESPSNIPLVKGSLRKTGTPVDSVPNTRRPPVAAAPRKSLNSVMQKPS